MFSLHYRPVESSPVSFFQSMSDRDNMSNREQHGMPLKSSQATEDAPGKLNADGFGLEADIISDAYNSYYVGRNRYTTYYL